MIIITSPAKTLDFEIDFGIDSTKPQFLDESAELMENLRDFDQEGLEKLFDVSENIAETNLERFKEWNKDHNDENSKPAISAYDGTIYKKLQREKYTKKDWNYLEDSLRIPSGLYGILKATDLIQPYRLEMSTKLKTSHADNLYEFWGDKLTNFLNEDAKKNDHKYLINLASDEYAKAIDFEKLEIPEIKIEFRQRKNGELKNYGILAKQARGLMINFMTLNQVKDLKEIKNFSEDGYGFMKEKDNSIFFVKDKE